MYSQDNTTSVPVPFPAGSLANLTLVITAPAGTATSYVVPAGTVSNCSPQVLTSLLANVALNASPPIAYAVTGGGSYCQGTLGLPVGLANSEVGVTYTLFKNTIAQVPTVTGTGSAITFGNQLNGTYTVSGTNGFGTTAMTGSR